jgi:hypothetical protein
MANTSVVWNAHLVARAARTSAKSTRRMLVDGKVTTPAPHQMKRDGRKIVAGGRSRRDQARRRRRLSRGVKARVKAGIPVFAQFGITPQTALQFGIDDGLRRRVPGDGTGRRDDAQVGRGGQDARGGRLGAPRRHQRGRGGGSRPSRRRSRSPSSAASGRPLARKRRPGQPRRDLRVLRGVRSGRRIRGQGPAKRA